MLFSILDKLDAGAAHDDLNARELRLLLPYLAVLDGPPLRDARGGINLAVGDRLRTIVKGDDDWRAQIDTRMAYDLIFRGQSESLSTLFARTIFGDDADGALAFEFAVEIALRERDLKTLRRVTSTIATMPSPVDDPLRVLMGKNDHFLMQMAMGAGPEIARHIMACVLPTRGAAAARDRAWLQEQQRGVFMLLAAGRAGDHLTVGRILRRARRCGMEKDLYTAVGDSLIFFAATRGATPQGGVDLIRQMHGAIGADGLTDIFARGNSSTLWALLRSGDRDVLPVLAALRQAIGMPGMARILANPWLTGPGMTAQNFRYVVSVARAIDSDLPFKMMTEENDGTLAGLYLAMCDDPDILDIADDVLDGRFYSRMIFPADGDLKKTLPYVMAGRASRDVLQVVKQKILDRCGVEGLKGFLHAPESAPVKARPDYMNIIEFVAKDIAPLFPGGHVYLPAATGALLLAHGNGTVPRHEFWQRMGGSPQRWRAITNKPAPAGLSDLSSPWQFKPKLYTELLPYARRLAALENAPRTAETYAHRLAVMFANRQEAERYLDAAALRARPDDAGAIFTRAMNFSIPARGLWDVKHWRGLMLKHGMAMTKFIAHAPAIETYCAENNRPLPDNIADLHAVAGMVIYPEAEKAPEFARYAMMFNLPVQDFLRGLPALQNAAPERSVPAVTIDGAEIGKANYYLERLPPGDPRGLVLGHITNSCQSVGGNGEYAAIHGTADKDGAFYLWRQKTRGKITPDDRIVAQSWVWMAEDRATLVLDSFERLSEVYNHLAQPFIEQLAHDLLQAGRIAGVRLGAGGGTPAMPDLTRAFNAVAPAKPGQQHPDSQTQYVIRPVDHRMGLIPA